MAATLSSASFTPRATASHRSITFNSVSRTYRIRCSGENNSSTKESAPENAIPRIAWYGSELLGIAASFLHPPTPVEAPYEPTNLATDGSGAVNRVVVVETIKQVFERSYFVTGQLTLDAYEENCEFADPAGSFKGLCRFKRNCNNFGSLIDKSDMKLMKWEDSEDKGIGHWRFSCIMSFPWRPILSATGYTEYYFDARTGSICRHVEHWNVPKMALLKQLLRAPEKLSSPSFVTLISERKTLQWRPSFFDLVLSRN